jgi:site-specific DNA-methyltransferase (adenine-specific)
MLNTIFNENCLETMSRMPDNFIDLTITSPPYDNLRIYQGFDFNFNAIANQLFRITKQGGVIVWVVADQTINGSETGTSFKQALRFIDIGFNLHDTMIWKKPTFTDTGSLKVRYGNVFEYMFVLSKGKVKTFNPLIDRLNKHAGSKQHGNVVQTDGQKKALSNHGKLIPQHGQRFNVWEFNTVLSKRERTAHPAVFPKQLVTDHTLSWTNENDLVYDPFMGSGTTALAARQLNRNFIGSEISFEYCEIANQLLRNIGDD